MKRHSILFLLLISAVYSTVAQQNCEPTNVLDTKKDPYKYICYLKKFNHNGTSFTSTAFLIAPRVLLTNAHNLYNAARYEIAAGHNGQGIILNPGDPTLTYGMITLTKTSTNTFYHGGFIINQNKRTKKHARHFDYGVIILPDNSLYDKLGGYLEIVESDEIAKSGDNVMFAGYPGGIKSYNLQLFQKTNTGIITGYYEQGDMISYELGIHAGASGSPIIVNKNGKDFVIGIHGYGSGCQSSAIKITKDVIANINKWTQNL